MDIILIRLMVYFSFKRLTDCTVIFLFSERIKITVSVSLRLKTSGSCEIKSTSDFPVLCSSLTTRDSSFFF